MRRILLSIFLGITLSPFAWAQGLCTQCSFEIDPAEKQYWGAKAFCGEGCKEEFQADRWRCKICNDRVDPPKSKSHSYSDGEFLYITHTPQAWDGFCDWCRERVKSGSVDPVKDRYRPEPDSPAEPAAPAPAPMAETAPPQDDHAKTVSVLDYLKWVFGVAMGLFIVQWGRNR